MIEGLNDTDRAALVQYRLERAESRSALFFYIKYGVN